MTDLATDSNVRRRLWSVSSGTTLHTNVSAPAILRCGSLAAACVVLAACSAETTKTGVVAAATPPAALPTPAAAPAVIAEAKPAAAGGYMVGKPYTIAGKTYAPAARKPGSVGVGLASWYGARFHGRRTANGETFDMQSLTAAHPTLPLPSYVRVTNVSNGRSLVVRVNDRGPFHKGRLIDVSQRTADVLGFRGAGVGNVKVDYVGLAKPSGSDDAQLIATYREFGRPAAPEGVQMAGRRPVSDAELVAGAPTLLASAETSPSASTEMTVGLRAAQAPAAVVAYAAEPSERPVAAALSRPGAPVPRAEPVTAADKAETAKPAVIAAKRVVKPAAPVLASVAPPVAADEAEAPSAKPNRAVAARIAASFEGFDSFGVAPQASPAAFDGLR